MNQILIGMLAGLAAAPAWIIVNLIVDFLFLSTIRRHTAEMNEVLLARPGINVLVLTADIAFWSALFGAGYGLVFPALERFGPAGAVLWGVFMFLAFSRSMLESTIWTKYPRDLNAFWFVEGLGGLAVWGAVLGFAFSRWI